jgi:hypothetical protein
MLLRPIFAFTDVYTRLFDRRSHWARRTSRRPLSFCGDKAPIFCRLPIQLRILVATSVGPHVITISCLPTDLRRPGGQSFQGLPTLLATAITAYHAAFDPGRTPHAHRRGTTIAAHKLCVARPTLNNADWAPTSTVLESSYLVSDLFRPPLAQQYFGDLLDPCILTGRALWCRFPLGLRWKKFEYGIGV